jgi:predicted nicotinamide N-methyase
MTMVTYHTDTKDHAPIQLSTLSKWVSPSVLAWLQAAEATKIARQAEIDEDDLTYTAALFQSEADKQEELELQQNRVQSWKTSVDNPDGEFNWLDNEHPNDAADENSCEVRVIYIISDSTEGHGNTLWPSSRHVSNLLANKHSCSDVLSPLLQQKKKVIDTTKHPLLGLSFVEFGAGAGVPSWTAMRCGARVVCTDQAVPDRIRCIAECAERNNKDLELLQSDGDILKNANLARACPYNWGECIDEVTSSLDNNEKFDVVVAADCCYMPLLQTKLLQSIDMLMSQEGVALVPFALHGNASDEDVWKIVDRAKQMGFVVEVLEPMQLTPSVIGMADKQGLVQTVRLTRQLSHKNQLVVE